MWLTDSCIYSSETGATTWRVLFAWFGLGRLRSQACAFAVHSDHSRANALKRIADVRRRFPSESRTKRVQHHLLSLIRFTLQSHFVLLVLRSTLRPNNWERLMKDKLCCGRIARFAMAFAIVAGVTVSACAQTLLIDFGNDASFRGATTASPDSNGNYWNSMQPGLFYTNLVGINNVGTGINFGFSSPVGTDSFNGPAGVTTNWPLTPPKFTPPISMQLRSAI